MYVAHVRLTKHYKHRKNEDEIEFEEDSASGSGDFISEGCLRRVCKVEGNICRFFGHRVIKTFLSC